MAVNLLGGGPTSITLRDSMSLGSGNFLSEAKRIQESSNANPALVKALSPMACVHVRGSAHPARPPLADARLHLLEDGSVTVEFKRPWSDGMRTIGLQPKAMFSRMEALAPPHGEEGTDDSVYSGGEEIGDRPTEERRHPNSDRCG